MSSLRVPCAYQGGKQRVAAQIVDALLAAAESPSTHFYDLCCGSGAISIELVNRGIAPQRIRMLDISSWGGFWDAIGAGRFDMGAFDEVLAHLPYDKRDFKAHVARLATRPVGQHEAEIYPVLQACSFGGKQIWRRDGHWANACFRDYWEPTATSVRRSPANPMQPGPAELRRRVAALANGMRGITCRHADIAAVLAENVPDDAIVYIDPPYRGTTGYAFDFDLEGFVRRFRATHQAQLFVSEGMALNSRARKLVFRGAKGGISGVRKGRHQEWLSRI